MHLKLCASFQRKNTNMNFGYTKLVFTLVVLVFCQILFSQSVLPYDTATGKTIYNYTIELDKSFKKELIYHLVQDWYSADAAQFNRTNVCDTAKIVSDKKKNENKETVLKEFRNEFPLQAVDPEGSRIAGKIVTKYFRTQNSCMRLIYLQYFLIINVEDNRLNCQINDVRYNHFNPKTYTPQRIFNWSNTSNCDPINTIEYLRDCEQCHDEFSGLVSFLNADVSELIYNLGQYLKTQKALTLNSAPN